MTESASGTDPPPVVLRDIRDEDLPIFFEYERDPVARHMAAFTSKDPDDRKAFDAHWKRILRDSTITKKTVLFNGRAVGSILKFDLFGQPSVAYWIGREFWGHGVATAALLEFLRVVPDRPLYARAAADNPGSLRVLEKCGFVRIGEDKGFANARGKETPELLLRLG